MSLIKCKECGKEISSEAPTCPGCGNPQKVVKQKQRSVFMIVLEVLIALFVIFVIAPLLFCGGILSTVNTSKGAQSHQDFPCTVTRIVDGDTFHCTAGGEDVTVRLIGVDTPEMPTPEGVAASKFTEGKIPPGTVVRPELDVQPLDYFRRTLAYVWLPEGTMLNDLIVQAGYALVMTVPPNVKYQDLFLKSQQEARENNRGLWE